MDRRHLIDIVQSWGTNDQQYVKRTLSVTNPQADGIRIPRFSLDTSCSVAQSCPTLHAHGLQHARLPCPSLSPGVYLNSCPLGPSTESVHCPSKYLILCLSLLLPSVFPSIRVFSNESALCIRWPKYWSFSFSIIPPNEYSGLISFRIDWFDLAVQGTLKSLLQHHSSKASILHCSAFFMVQFSQPYVTIGKTLALTTWTFVCKVMMSLLFNTGLW